MTGIITSALKIIEMLMWWKKKKIEDAENPEKQLEVRREQIDNSIATHDEKSVNALADNAIRRLR